MIPESTAAPSAALHDSVPPPARHPSGLATFFTVEVWERFSFYGMQSLLLIYLYFSPAQGGLGYPLPLATAVVGAYGGGIYMATVLGSWVADRVLGPERTLLAGAVVVLCGHVALAVLPATAGLVVGLTLVALGAGSLKANASSLVGRLYALDDPRRDAGYSFFYSGIYVGAVSGPLVTGLLQVHLGFHGGFGAAAVGMGAGLLLYLARRRRLPAEFSQVPHPLDRAAGTRMLLLVLAGGLLLAAALGAGAVPLDGLDLVVAAVIVVLAAGTVATMLTDARTTHDERRRVLAYLPLFAASTVFWLLYQQQLTVLTVFSERQLDRNVAGWTMPIGWIQAITPLFVLVLSPLAALLWQRWRKGQPTSAAKFTLAVLLAGVSFLLFAPLSTAADHSAPLSAVVGIMLIVAVAELLLSPIGLSLASRIAPRAFPTQMVGLTFLSLALGTALSGRGGALMDPARPQGYYLALGLVALGTGTALFLALRWINRNLEAGLPPRLP